MRYCQPCRLACDVIVSCAQVLLPQLSRGSFESRVTVSIQTHKCPHVIRQVIYYICLYSFVVAICASSRLFSENSQRGAL
jgi:hypothetical protein